MNKKFSVIIILSITIVLSLYFYMFHNGLSSNSTSWSEFGDYINGVLTPILTILNIYVFVKLTNSISERDSVRSEREMSYQKQIVLMQFRKDEIDSFLKIMNDALVIKKETDVYELSEPVMYAMNYLETFATTKLSLFNLNEESDVARSIKEYHQKTKELYHCLIENRNTNRDSIIKMLNLKSFIVRQLQTITLEMK